MIDLLAGCALVVLVHATLWFAISVVAKRNDVADVAWGMGYVVLCAYLVASRPTDARDVLLYGLVTIWGLRLSWHILRRTRDKPEDFRYRKWREEWGRLFVVRSYLQVFLLQGLLLLVIAAPVVVSAGSAGPPLGWLAWAGAGVWLVGFIFEAVGDWQLARFKADPANEGELMTRGLWRYTRHPNYFGEVTLWWGVFLVAVPVELGGWTVVSPLVVTGLILFVSGIPMLEEKYEDDPRWEAYKARTSAFVPLPPKRMKGEG